MCDNYPPGATYDPRAPYNQPSTEFTSLEAAVEIYNEDDTSEIQKFKVDVELCSDLSYSELDIRYLIADELDLMLNEVEYDLLDYKYL